MIKLLLIFFIIFYLLFKVGGFFIRTLLGGNTQSAFSGRGDQHKQQRPRNGNVNVDYSPKKDGEIKGGEYVDYEEVK